MFKDKLIELMKENNVTQRELANDIKITESAMSRYISGERKPRVDIISKIARRFNVSIEELYYDSEKLSSYKEIHSLVARNASNLTNEEIAELISLLTKSIKNEIKK